MENIKIALIIDDEPAIHVYLEHVLKTKGIQSISAESLDNATDLLALHKPDIIFVDNYLPDGQGIEHIPQLHRVSPNSKIIAMTSEHQLRNKAFMNGANHFLGKPFTIMQVYCTIGAYA